MKYNIFKVGLFLITSALLFTACLKDKAGEGNNEEVITTMVLKFTPAGGGAPLTFSFDDPDGPGGNTPAQNVISLTQGVSYNMVVQLLNKTATPAINITDEVAAESAAHRFYYETTLAGLTISNLNNDTNGVPLGINSTWSAGPAGTGSTKITLRHYPGTPPGKETADLVNSSKSGTDIEIIFVTNVL